jgi:LL-diaminopimelate aminotransferase
MPQSNTYPIETQDVTLNTETTNTNAFEPIEPNSRLASLPLYVFASLEGLKQSVRESGLALIDLGMGNPDQPTHPDILNALHHAILDPENHGYPSFKGKATLREAIAQWMHRRYHISLNPDSQILPLIGSKEGIANVILAYLEPGDICLVPSLYYPTYQRSTVIAGGTPYFMPLTEDTHFLPDLDAIPAEVCKKAKLLLLNYPNNPTGAEASAEFYEKAIAFAKLHRLVLVTDMAYGEIAFDDYQPLSIMEFEGAEDVAIEFHSFSKTFHMAGWRLGFAVGAKSVIRNLYLGKTTIDYGVCNAIQDAGTYALNHAERLIKPMCAMYQERRDYLVQGFSDLGWEVQSPKSSFYLWMKIPPVFEDSYEWIEYLMRQTGVVVTPGGAFGSDGDTYFRVSLVSPMEKLKRALKVLHQKGIRFDMEAPDKKPVV